MRRKAKQNNGRIVSNENVPIHLSDFYLLEFIHSNTQVHVINNFVVQVTGVIVSNTSVVM